MCLCIDDGFLKILGIFFGQFVFVLGLHFLGLVNCIVKIVLHFDCFALFLILFGMCLGFFSSLFDLFFIEVTTALDSDTLLFAGAFIFGGDVQNTVGIN